MQPLEAIKDITGISPLLLRREINNRSFYEFLKFFWPVLSRDRFIDNWHIKFLCDRLQNIAERVVENKPREGDLIINIPPGTTKTTICSIMFPVWCWTKAIWLKIITVSYSLALSLESAELSRDLIRSELFKAVYPELSIKEDKDTKGNYKVVSSEGSIPGCAKREKAGGNRFSTSVGGPLTGFHGHIIIVDDPMDPRRAVSAAEVKKANYWIDNTLMLRRTDKEVTPVIIIMQRLAVEDTTGYLLSKNSDKIKHICLPGEIKNFAKNIYPAELALNYKNGLLDPQRLSWPVLMELEARMGQFGYASQIGQSPVPAGGGMFKVDHVQVVLSVDSGLVVRQVRYWDKAGTAGGGAYTVGVKMAYLSNGRWLVMDVKRGRWSSEEREKVIKETALADGYGTVIRVEQEPGSGGKESAEATIRNLAGFMVEVDRPVGDKTTRADPFSVQVNSGNVWLLKGDWNKDYLEELANFPQSMYKDQVDASSGAFAYLVKKKMVRQLI